MGRHCARVHNGQVSLLLVIVLSLTDAPLSLTVLISRCSQLVRAVVGLNGATITRSGGLKCMTGKVGYAGSALYVDHQVQSPQSLLRL